MGCNTCRCGDHNRLFCTKMACINKKHVEKFKKSNKLKEEEIERAKEKKKNQRQTNPKKVSVKAPFEDIKEPEKESDEILVKRVRKELKSVKNDKKGKSDVKNNKKGLPDELPVKRVRKELKSVKDDKNKSDTKKNEKGLPDLPEGPCVPGKFYQNDCYGCFCEETKIAVCSNKQRACEPNHQLKIPQDVRPAFTKLERAALPILPSMASRCEPGRSYRVSCNTCLCMPNYSLLCDQLLCLSQDDINRIDAHKKTGTSCKTDDDLPKASCVKCSCVDGKTSCEHRIGCQLPSILRQLATEEDGTPQMTLDVEKDKKCVPFTVYKNNCNKCYCQEDGTMRCTLKVCLNYVQSLKLQKHRLHLEKYGL